MYDPAGFDKFDSLSKQFYRNLDVCLVCFDLSNRESFDNIPKWIETYKQHCYNKKSIIIVGNKSDLKKRADITESDYKKLFDKYKYEFW